MTRDGLLASGLLDAAWYLAQNPDVASDPAGHYADTGCREDRRPNPYFDPRWYRRAYPSFARAEMPPLLHYLHVGERLGYRPAPYFDPAWYRRAYALGPSGSALAHFLAHRLSGRYAPCAELFAVALIAPYRDDAARGEDPFLHYLREAPEVSCDATLVGASGLLDTNHYLIQSGDVLAAGFDAVEHFCVHGWREGRRPNAYFDTAWYLRTNPDAERLGVNPLVHYLLLTEPAGRRPVPYFDPAWYRRTYGVRRGRSALAHFLAHRREQAVSPTPLFDVAWYVARHASELGPYTDPFAHFLQAGMTRDIDPGPAFSTRDYRRRHMGRPSRAFRHLLTPERDNPLVAHLRAEYGYDAGAFRPRMATSY